MTLAMWEPFRELDTRGRAMERERCRAAGGPASFFPAMPLTQHLGSITMPPEREEEPPHPSHRQ